MDRNSGVGGCRWLGPPARRVRWWRLSASAFVGWRTVVSVAALNILLPGMVNLARRSRMPVGLVLLLPLVGAAQCQQAATATVNYTQIGACNGFYRPDGSQQVPASQHAYVVFRITTVNNTASGASD